MCGDWDGNGSLRREGVMLLGHQLMILSLL